MDPSDSAAIIFAIIVGLGLGAAALAWRQAARKRLERLSPAFELGTCRPAGTFGTAVEGLYKGYTCRYTIQYASQYDPGGALLRINATGTHRWSAELANTGSRLLVKFGLAKDFDIGDRVLDERFRFSADDEAALQSVFGTESARDAMHTLAATDNFKGVGAREERVDFRWAPRSRALDEDTDTVRFRLETATNFAGACNLTPRLGS
jgi:hypothetical protein